jgi:hypothetical protein
VLAGLFLWCGRTILAVVPDGLAVVPDGRAGFPQ